MTQQQEEFVSLTDEHQTLTSDNQQLSSKVEQQQQQQETYVVALHVFIHSFMVTYLIVHHLEMSLRLLILCEL